MLRIFGPCLYLTLLQQPDLPDVLHHLNFQINPGEKVSLGMEKIIGLKLM